MTAEQKYSELLRELGKLIKEKNDTICIQGFQNSNLKKELENANKELNELKKGTKDGL